VLQPEWITFDSRLATLDDINKVLHCYADDDVLDSCSKDAAIVGETLALHSYTAATVQKTFRFPGPPTPGPFYVRKRVDHRAASALPSQQPRTALDVLLRLFLIGVTVPADLAVSLLGSPCVLAMHRLGLIGASPLDDAQILSYVQLYPLALEPALQSAVGDTHQPSKWPGSDVILATDWPPPVSCSLEEEPVMYIGSDSLGLVRMAAIAKVKSASVPDDSTSSGAAPLRVLDLCTGSGIQGIAFARMSALLGAPAAVTCVDINPRAGRFARFNAALNGLDVNVAGEGCVQVCVGDLYKAVSGKDHTSQGGRGHEVDGAGGRFDVILANPPFVPVPQGLNDEVKRYDIFADGGGRAGTFVQKSAVLRAFWESADSCQVLPLLLLEPPSPCPPTPRPRPPLSDSADGEAIIGSILAGIPAHLQRGGTGENAGKHAHGGGWLCLVTELCNPRDFPAKIRAWMMSNEEIKKSNQGPPLTYKGLVFHDASPHEYSVARYSEVRAGSVAERPRWQQHLHACNISSVARGYLFLQLIDAPPADGAWGGGDVSDGKRQGAKSDGDVARDDSVQAVSQLVGWDGEMSTWAPMNTDAASAFSRALSVLARVRFD